MKIMNVSAVLVAVVSLMLGACDKKDGAISTSIKKEEVRHKEATSAEKARHLKEVSDIKSTEARELMKEQAKAVIVAEAMKEAKAIVESQSESLKQKMEATKRWSWSPSANP
jgi:hypothetical protein